MELLKTFNLSQMGVNCYITKIQNEIVIFDAPDEIDKVITYLNSNEYVPSKLILTHYHFDHMLGIDLLKETYPNLKIYCNKEELKDLFDPTYTLAQFYGITHHNKHEVLPVDNLVIDNLIIETISGHSPHSSVFIFTDSKIVICGDTLFKDTIGRTDIPFGDSSSLISGIKRYLLTLDDEYVVYPGHGDKTTIGYEKNNNPFLK